MTHGSLFSGIGGFDLAAEWMGWENKFHCEWNPFGQKVLHHYWPQAEQFTDITKTDFKKYANKIDVLTGGFPCQPYSSAGKRLGKADDRHLWPHMLRAIKEIQPRWVVGENVLGLVNWSGGLVFHEVQTDLEAAGYEVFPYVLPACGVNAPHRRDRIWFVAYAKNDGYGRGDKFRENIGIQERSLHKCEGQRWDEIWPKSERLNEEWPTSKPNRNPTGTSGQSTSIKGIGGSNDVQQSERRSKTELNNRPSSVPRDVTHPNRNGQQWGDSQHEINTGEGREHEQRDLEQMDGDAADPNGIGLRGQSNRAGESRFIGQNDPGNYWQNFPTQSPICTRNDGLSSRLDGITFSIRQHSRKHILSNRPNCKFASI